MFAPKDNIINQLIKSLLESFLLQDAGDVSAFLGIQVRKDPTTQTFSVTQPSLLEQVINDVGVDTFIKGRDTPTDYILNTDPNGPDRQENWNYRSVLGKLNYIANIMCPNISMADHQCARFCSNPKAIHKLAIIGFSGIFVLQKIRA
jgi:hypothetical protein